MRSSKKKYGKLCILGSFIRQLRMILFRKFLVNMHRKTFFLITKHFKRQIFCKTNDLCIARHNMLYKKDQFDVFLAKNIYKCAFFINIFLRAYNQLTHYIIKNNLIQKIQKRTREYKKYLEGKFIFYFVENVNSQL